MKHKKPLITINFILSSPPLSVFLSAEHFLLCGPFCLETSRELLNLNLFKRRFKNLQFSGFHGWLLSYGFLSCNQRAMGTMCAIAAMIFSCNQRAMWAMCAKGTQYCDEAGIFNAPNAFSMSITGPNQIVFKFQVSQIAQHLCRPV